ncbi:MAG: S8 family serine peptidase, partial [Elusimicrobia bacterium]|nr:S8 family serine peptidase [Elusimicrobiota bacterium]
RGVAAALVLALAGLSGGLEPWASAAQVARAGAAARGAAPLGGFNLRLQSAGTLPGNIPGLQVALGAGAAPLPAAVPAPAPAAAAAAANPFELSLRRLRAPDLIESLPAQAAQEEVQGAAADDFAARLGAAPAAVDAVAGAPVSRAPAAGGLARRQAAPAGRQSKSVAFPAAAAGAAFSLWEGIRAAAAWLAAAAGEYAAAAPASCALHVAAAAAGWAVLAAGVVFAAVAAADAASFGYGIWRGRGVTDAEFWDFARGEVLAGRLDAGVAELLRVHRPSRRSWSLELGFSAGGYIYLRPELAATPWLLRRVLAHELRHARGASQRGPPAGALRRWARRVGSELAARVGEFKAARVVLGARVPVLERALRLAQISLALARPYDALVINPRSPELAKPAIYESLSRGRARVEVLETSEPRTVLGDPRNQRRFQAVVLDSSQFLLPQSQSPEAKRLDQALKQFDALFVLATRLTARGGAFRKDSAFARRYEELAVLARKLDLADRGGRERFGELVRGFWREVASQRLKDVKLSGLVADLYESMPHKGLAFIPFEPDDAGLPVWEKLLRFWQAADGGQFRLVRVDLENGGHILILRKVEARVGLWLRPKRGFIAATIPDAAASAESREAARTALAAAGFGEDLDAFDELQVEVQHVFGADIGRQEIYVTVPRRNAGAIRRFVAGLSVEIGASRADFMPQLFESAALHNVKPVWQAGITGSDGTIMWIDTGVDRTHSDFADRLDAVDMVNEGIEDWNGHGTHGVGISISGAAPFLGMAKGARGIMAKVFSREYPGAADGNIMGAAAIGMQRCVDVINLSLGIRGSSGDNLAVFFSQLTHQKNANGEYPFVTASAGNSGPFDRSLSQPAAGVDVNAVAAAAIGEDDRLPEVAFYSSVGPDVDKRYAVKRLRLKPDVTAKGGDVVSEPGSDNVYRLGVYSAKSQNTPRSPSDTADGKHTGLSGTSMASPMIAGIALLVKLAFRLTGAQTPFVKENLPLVLRAVLMRTADDMQVPAWFQGAGFVNAWAAVKLVADAAGFALGSRAARLWARFKGETRAAAPDAWGWVERYQSVRMLEDRVYSAAEIVKAEAKARFEDAEAGAEAPEDGRRAAGDAVQAEVQERFGAVRAEVLPRLLQALEDPVWLVRREAAMVLLNLKAPESALPLAQAALNDADGRVRQLAALALAEIPTHAVDVLLQKAAADPRWDVAIYSAYALARHGDRGGAARIVSELSHKDKWVRFSAAWLLGQLGNKATAAEAEALSYLVKNASERGNIRHLAAAALANIAGAAGAAFSDQVVKDLLEACGPQNLALTRTIAKVFPAALQDQNLLARVRGEPLRSVVSDFVRKNRFAAGRPGALGELVSLLARAADVSLDLPTPVQDPSGLGVAGVDPGLGDLDVIVGLPEPMSLSAYRDFRGDLSGALEEAGLSAAELSRYEARLQAALPLSRSLWVSVPPHKLFAFGLALRDRGYSVRVSQPEYSLSRQTGESAWEGVTVDLTEGYRGAPAQADLSLVRVVARPAVSEA